MHERFHRLGTACPAFAQDRARPLEIAHEVDVILCPFVARSEKCRSFLRAGRGKARGLPYQNRRMGRVGMGEVLLLLLALELFIIETARAALVGGVDCPDHGETNDTGSPAFPRTSLLTRTRNGSQAPAMNQASVTSIAHIIQLAVAPVFLLAGIGGILNVVATRLARVVDRVRSLEQRLEEVDAETGAVMIRELEILDRRMGVCHWSIGLSTSAALFICLVVMILFVADLVSLNFAVPVSLLFIAAMVSLTLGLLLFLFEVTIATRFVRVDEKLLRRQRAIRLQGRASE